MPRHRRTQKGSKYPTRSLAWFIEEGLKQGHEEKYYETNDQRFLGEERFLNKVAERSEAREVEIRGKKGNIARLLEAISQTHDVQSEVLLSAGRQRRWVAVRAQLVYLARQWCGLTTKSWGGGCIAMHR